MKRILVACLLFFASAVHAQDLTVAVSANAEKVFQHVKVEFERETGFSVAFVIGSSGKLTSQIEHGAPFDVFLSADSDYPAHLFSEQIAITRPRVYARGQLALWSTTGAKISQDLSTLLDPKIRRIAIADPGNAPYGRETVGLLNRLGLYAKLQEKIVTCESIAQVNQYVTTGNVDVGFTSISSFEKSDNANQITFALDLREYTPIPQAAVLLRHGARSAGDAARKFLLYLYSPAAQKIFAGAGYLAP